MSSQQTASSQTPTNPLLSVGGTGGTQTGETIASLEEKLDKEKDERREERFVWIVVCVILIDVIWLRSARNVTMSLAVLTLEMVILFVIAKRLGIEEIAEFVSRISEKISGKA